MMTLSSKAVALTQVSSPSQADFNQLVRGKAKDLKQLVAQLASSGIELEQFKEEFSSLLLDGHTQAWALGRQLSGDLRPLNVLDQYFGIAARDSEADFIIRFIDALLLRDSRYFDADGNLVEQSVLSRAKLYLGKLRGTANEAFVEASPEYIEFWWRLGGAEKHCSDCPQIAGLSPFVKDTLFTVPGQGDTPCLGNCKCYLRREDGVKGFKPLS